MNYYAITLRIDKDIPNSPIKRINWVDSSYQTEGDESEVIESLNEAFARNASPGEHIRVSEIERISAEQHYRILQADVFELKATI